MRGLVTGLAAASLLAVGLHAPAAQAAGETCRGVPATHVGSAGLATLTGTEGPDVIVTNGAVTVAALGGDDLICVTGSTPFSYVDAGDGNDVVDATGATGGTNALLGEGDDTYLGSTSFDNVTTGAADNDDSGADVVDTGPAGDEADAVESGEGSLPNPDRITGGSMTLTWAGTPTAGSAVDGGQGSLFAMSSRRGGSTLAIDTRKGTLATSSGPVMDLHGFTRFNVRAWPDLKRFTFGGSNRDENVFLSGSPDPVARIAMRGGDDRLVVSPFARASSFKGGRGQDVVDVESAGRVHLDLRRGTLRTVKGKRAGTREAKGFEHAFVRATAVGLVGTHGRNKLLVDACRADVEGLGGRDTITAFNNGYDDTGDKCRGRRMKLLGGPGNDNLIGSAARDLLIGGPGRDRADGGPGRDTCQAEVRRSCEVRR